MRVTTEYLANMPSMAHGSNDNVGGSPGSTCNEPLPVAYEGQCWCVTS